MAGKDFKVGVVIVGKDRASGIMGKSLNRIGKAAGRARAAVGGLVGKLGGLGTIAGLAGAGLAARGIYKLAEGAAQSGDKLAKTSRLVGLTAQAYAELKHASDIAGVSGAEFDTSMKKFSRTIGETKAGTGSLVTLLQKTSPALLEQVKATANNEEALNLMLTAMSKFTDEGKRAAFAAAVFGRSGQKMALLTENGTEAVTEARKEFSKYFGDVGGAGLKSAENFIDAQARMKLAIGGVKYAIGSQLLPVLQPLMDRFRDWIVVNRGVIAQKVAGWVGGIGEKLSRLGEWADGPGARLWKTLSGGAEMVGGALDLMTTAVGGSQTGILALTTVALIATGPLGVLAATVLSVATAYSTLKTAYEDWRGTRAGGEYRKLAKPTAEYEEGFQRIKREFGIDSAEAMSLIKQGPEGIASKREQRKAVLHEMLSSLGGQGSVEVNVSFAGAPPGMSVDRPVTKGPVTATVNTGRRTLATAGAR
jgi:hypothetical protein